MSGKFSPREMPRRTFSGSKTSPDNSETTSTSPPTAISPSGADTPSVDTAAPSAPASAPASAPPSSPSPIDSGRRVPSLRQIPDAGSMHTSTNPLGLLRTQRQPAISPGLSPSTSASTPRSGNRLLDLMNRRSSSNKNAFSQNSQSGLKLGTAGPGESKKGGLVAGHLTPSTIQGSHSTVASTPPMHLNLPGRPAGPGQTQSSPLPMKISKMSKLAARRGLDINLNLPASDMTGGSAPASASGSGVNNGASGLAINLPRSKSTFGGSQLDDFREFINPEQGWLNFNGSATLTKEGVHFANGNTYSMSLDEIESLGELGKGNYGTVYKVRHAKSKQSRMGRGLSGSNPLIRPISTDHRSNPNGNDDGLSGTIMAMKEIRMELDKAKFKTIAKELMILHQCASPYIIDFYGAFMQDGFVYMCIEYMDGGSIDKLYKDGVPDDVLQHITLATVLGLNELKEKHNIIHRDVKPTNILVNTRGQIKICDFGVSGDLVASKAKTNIGCQSYMPPERIHSNPIATEDDGSYGVQSDIWSLGLTIIECALGKYPYDVNASILVQLNTIVKGEAPKLPETGYSDIAQDFVASCLAKNPAHRPTYTALLRHAWLASITKPAVIKEEDEEEGAEDDGKGKEPRPGLDTDVAVNSAADAVGQMVINSQPNLPTSFKPTQQPNDELVADWVKAQLQKKAVGK